MKSVRSGIIQLAFGASLISFSAVFVRLAHVGPTVAGFYRMIFALVFLLPAVRIRRETLWCGGIPFLFALLCGLLFALDLSLWHRSIWYVGPGLATVLANFQVFFLAVVGILIFRERCGWRFVVSVPLAMLGLFLLVGLEWDQLSSGYRRGVLFGILTAATYAVFLLLLKKSQSRERRLSPAANLVLITLATAAMMGSEGIVLGEAFRIPDLQSAAALLAYGGICQALAWVIITRAIPRVEASRVGLILLLQPTLAFVWDILFFGRPTAPIEILGAAITLWAIYLGSTRR